MIRIIRGTVLLFVVLSCVRLSAQSAESLANGVSLFGSPRFVTMQVEMILSQTNGTKNRTLDVFFRRDGAKTSVMIHVVSPGFLSSLKFLTQMSDGDQDSTWMKTSAGVRRLTDAGGSERVFDSDFRAEDFMGISLRRFSLSLAPDAVIDSVPCKTLEARPLVRAGYASKLMYISTPDFILRGVDYLDAAGKLLRKYRLTSTQSLEGRTYPLTAEMTDMQAGSSTTLKVTRTDAHTAIPDSVFNKGSL